MKRLILFFILLLQVLRLLAPAGCLASFTDPVGAPDHSLLTLNGVSSFLIIVNSSLLRQMRVVSELADLSSALAKKDVPAPREPRDVDQQDACVSQAGTTDCSRLERVREFDHHSSGSRAAVSVMAVLSQFFLALLFFGMVRSSGCRFSLARGSIDDIAIFALRNISLKPSLIVRSMRVFLYQEVAHVS